MKEKPKQSLENQLQMARPRRSEVKRVPLTPEEKAFLGEIMDKAVAAEKAGKLAEALGYYTDYKNELNKIKEEKEQIEKIKNTRQKFIEWLSSIFIEDTNIESWTDANVDFSKYPKIIVDSPIKIEHKKNCTEMPENLEIDGEFSLKGTSLGDLPNNLHVRGNLNLLDTDIVVLPDDIRVDCKVISNASKTKLRESVLKAINEGRVKGLEEQ